MLILRDKLKFQSRREAANWLADHGYRPCGDTFQNGRYWATMEQLPASGKTLVKIGFNE